VPDYEQCQFCERIFEVALGEGSLIDFDAARRATPLDQHIRREHSKVRLRKGSNYKWVDAAEMKRLAESWAEMRRAAASGTGASKGTRRQSVDNER
jgi:hypothetical protein